MTTRNYIFRLTTITFFILHNTGKSKILSRGHPVRINYVHRQARHPTLQLHTATPNDIEQKIYRDYMMMYSRSSVRMIIHLKSWVGCIDSGSVIVSLPGRICSLGRSCTARGAGRGIGCRGS